MHFCSGVDTGQPDNLLLPLENIGFYTTKTLLGHFDSDRGLCVTRGTEKLLSAPPVRRGRPRGGNRPVPSAGVASAVGWDSRERKNPAVVDPSWRVMRPALPLTEKWRV